MVKYPQSHPERSIWCLLEGLLVSSDGVQGVAEGQGEWRSHVNMEGPQLPAPCPGNAFQFRGHSYVLITPKKDAVCVQEAAELGRGCDCLHVSGYPWADRDGFLP